MTELGIRLAPAVRPPLVDIERFEREAADAGAAYRGAHPFPHAVLDDVLLVPPSALDQFPDPDWSGWRSLGDSYQFRKYYCQDADIIPEPFLGIITELSRPRFLELLTTITGI